MQKLILLSAAAAALFVSAGVASAQFYYSGPGFGEHIEPRYEERYERRGYRNRDDREDARRYRDAREYGPRMNPSGNGCRANYTVQDGVCKPYTGR